MSFKIVNTIERGSQKLYVVPALWENGGLLKRPKIGAVWLAKDKHSTPGPGWTCTACSVKKRNIVSYEEAEKALQAILNKTNTGYEEEQNDCGNFSPSSNEQKNGQPSHTAVAWPLLSEDSGSENSTPPTDDIQKILHNQTMLFSITDKIVKNQKKILNRLDSLSVQMQDSFTKIHNLSTFTASLEQAFAAGDRADDSVAFKQITNHQELDEMEHLLSDNETRKKFKNSCLFVCTGGPKSGPTCAYRFIDTLFTREFLCECSWAGGSRSESTKICLKAYKNVLGFFFEMINHWDPCYTLEESENFFKMILRNSYKRSLSKGMRVSTPKNRAKRIKPAIKMANTDDETHDDGNDDQDSETVTTNAPNN